MHLLAFLTIMRYGQVAGSKFGYHRRDNFGSSSFHCFIFSLLCSHISSLDNLTKQLVFPGFPASVIAQSSYLQTVSFEGASGFARTHHPSVALGYNVPSNQAQSHV